MVPSTPLVEPDHVAHEVVGAVRARAALGDEQWVKLLQAHDRLVHEHVDRHRGHVVKNQGDTIQALYSSSSGGHTENNENVWGGTPLPYLRGVPDKPDAVSANPNHEWSPVEMSFREFEGKLQAAYGIGQLERFVLVKPFGVSGRVTVVKDDGSGGVKIVGSRNTYRESGWDIRSVLSLKDTLFDVRYDTTTNRNVRPAYRALDRRPGDHLGRRDPDARQ